MKDHLHEIVQLSLGSTPEEMLKKALDTCIEWSGASGGSILGEEGPYLQFIFSDVADLIGVRVPLDSIAGNTVNNGLVIYTYAPKDSRHFTGVDEQIQHVTKYLLSIPIPPIHRSTDSDSYAKNSGALQLLFEDNLFPDINIDEGPQEFNVNVFRKNHLGEKYLSDIFWILPLIAFGMEVMQLRHTSYQAIHELKNKLIAGLSWINYLKKDIGQKASHLLDDENIREDFELSESSIREGVDLATTYLQFTKIYTPHFAPTNVNDILKETAASVNVLAAKLEAKNFKVILELDRTITVKNIDESQLKMAFFNLCKNAVETLVDHKKTEPVIKITSSCQNGRIEIVIADNGPGMPPEIADHLFLPFKTKKEGGTGLGLAITKKIVDVHAGSIRCETGSEGTTFRILI